MRNRLSFSVVLLFLPLAALQDTCRRQAEPPPPPPASAPASEPTTAPPGAKTSSVEHLQPRLSVKWEDGAAAKLVIELGIENMGPSPLRLGFSNSGRVCGIVLDSAAAASKGPRGSKGEVSKGYRFPQLTAQVMGEETFPPGQTRTFRHEVRQSELGKGLAPSYTVEAWLCGHEKLRQSATAKTSDRK